MFTRKCSSYYNSVQLVIKNCTEFFLFMNFNKYQCFFLETCLNSSCAGLLYVSPGTKCIAKSVPKKETIIVFIQLF